MDFTRFHLQHFLAVLLVSRLVSAQEDSAAPSTAIASSGETTNSSAVPPTLNTIQSETSSFATNSSNVTGAGCLIDPQLGLVAAASAGGLILCLLVSTLVLACQVCHLQRRVLLPRPSRSNMDLVSGTGYWGTDRPEAAGIVGPCDNDVMLEEVRADGHMEEVQEAEEKEESEKEGEFEEDEEEEEGAGSRDVGLGGAGEMANMQSSFSRESCQEEVPLDLENMPLVV